jgi:exodeoxyribonuclease III
MSTNRFKVATFNVNSVRSRIPVVIDWLHEHGPDVLCLQETKVEDKDFPASDFEAAGYHVSFCGQKRWNGVAIVSKAPLASVSFGFEEGPPEEGPRMIRGVASGVTYIPQGREVTDEQFAYKIGWFERLRRLFEARYRPEDLILWCGDLNHAPEPIDVYAPKEMLGHVCFHPEVDRVFRDVTAWGFVDVFRKHCSEPNQYSFYDYRVPNGVKRRLGWRLDHILVTRPLAESSSASYIDLEPRLKPKPSDHTPVVAEFNLERRIP